MKSKSTLPEPTSNEDHGISVLENTFELVSNVFKLAKKVFML
ncbi:hypothetical protein [Winogradskyella bathintestinalis]|uniref:Uncharacterized protein n=1 Tax=Winogradskyella bathintestinalis TaxID=3035208 RepID=A0ABT7ZRR2_9FLAO|nr:hypothetical protein [Winogradskyella bathintestinalis]MDN3491653.1 hypothetical protein [Winogradskyella bathintestinalis]